MEEKRVSTLEIRFVDALLEDEGCWTWNSSFFLGEFIVPPGTKDDKAFFLRKLKKFNITCCRGKCRVDASLPDILELQVRKTGEPLIAGIFHY